MAVQPRIAGTGVTCEDCLHAALTSGGVYCRLFLEDIWDPRTAADCEAYESTEVSLIAEPEPKPKLSVVPETAAVPEQNERFSFPQLDYLVESEIRELCEHYLAQQNFVLWGKANDVNSPKGREAAAAWLTEQIFGVFKIAEEAEECVS